MTQIDRLDRTFSLIAHRDLTVVEVTELVDKWTSRRVDKLLVLSEYVAFSVVIYKQRVCAFADR